MCSYRKLVSHITKYDDASSFSNYNSKSTTKFEDYSKTHSSKTSSLFSDK